MNLNTKSINALQFAGTPRKIADTGTSGEAGLHIRVSKSAKTWTLKYRHEGKTRWHKLGTWDKGHGTSLSRARELARDFKVKLADGHNPDAIEDNTVQATLGDLLDAYYADCEAREVASLNQMRAFQRKIQPRYRQVPAGDVDAATIHKILHPIAAKTPVMANRVHTFLSSAFNWALRQEFALDRNRDLSFGITRNVIQDVPKLKAAEKPSEVHLTMRNLAAAFTHAHEYGSPTTALAIQFHIASGGIRMYDSLHRRWDEFIEVERDDSKIPCIRIPKDKAGKERVVPVGRHGLEILKQLQLLTCNKEVMFPARSSNRTPVSTIGIGQATRKLREAYPAMGEYSSRFVRRCAKTSLLDAGMDRVMVDTLHGHHIKKYSNVATKHYNFSHNLPVTIPVMEKWDELLEQALAEYQEGLGAAAA